MIQRSFAFSVLCASALGIGACSHAQLLPSPPTDAARAEGQDLLRDLTPHLPDCQGTLVVKGQDLWSSWFWRLTPLGAQQASFELRANSERMRLRLPAQDLEFLWEAGTIRKKHVAEASWVPHESWLDRLYLESLALYLRLPLLIARAHNHAATGPHPTAARQDQGLFFTLEPASHLKIDQFVAYFNRETLAIKALRFTYRDLSPAYTGWLRWDDRRATPFGPYPFHIRIQETYDAPLSDHELILDSLSCEPTSP